MSDTLTPEERSERMSRIRAKDTGPEMKVRRMVHGLGYRYRLHGKGMPGKPDLVFAKRRAVIFVHGCFWHQHPDPACTLARQPKSKQDFWGKKFDENRRRDERNKQALAEAGWRVLEVWECQLRDAGQLEVAIREFLGGNVKSIELFAGAGGLGLGTARAGFHPAKVVEWDEYCVETIRENKARNVRAVRGWPVVHGDVRDVDFKSLSGKVALVSGGPPCQPFSLGGKHGAHKDSRDLWSEAVRAVRETQPKAFIFENVKGLTRETFATYVSYIQLQLQYPSIERGKREDWSSHLSRLERHHTSGKKKSEYRLVMRLRNAANFGVPQRRERVFFVGFRADLGIEWSFPDETHSLDALIWQQVVTGEYWERNEVAKKDRAIPARFEARARFLERAHGGVPEGTPDKPWRTVREALAHLPDPQRDPDAAAELLNHRFQAGARTYPGHTGSPLDEPAKTLKAGVHGVPGGENMLLRPDGSVRYFTVRESAELQTFPRNYKFHGSWTETMRQLGNAVPVKLAAVVAKDVAKHLEAAG